MFALWRYLSGLLAVCLLAMLAATPVRAATRLEACVAPLAGTKSVAQAFDCNPQQNRLGPGDFGVQLRFVPTVSRADDPLVLRHTSVWQDAERVVFHYADGTTASLAFDSRDARRFMTIGAIFELPVPVRAAPLDGIYVEIRNSANWRGVMLGPELMKRSESEEVQRWLIALYAGFGGLSLALLAYNLALWSVLRHRFQLIYSAMVGALVAYTFTSSSLAMRFIPALENNDRLRLNYVLLCLAGVLGLHFMRDFFGPRVIGPRLQAAVKIVPGIALAVSLSFALLAPRFGFVLDRLYFIATAAMMLILFPLIAAAWRARVKYFWLFMLAWAAPIGVSVLRLAHGLGLLAYNFWLDNGNLVAMSIEALLSTLLIVTRLRELSQDRDAARAGEQSALRLANSDPLTGLLNRRAFIDLAIGRKDPHRLLLIDIDRFKSINDRLGHDTGDGVLAAVAEVLQDCRPPGSLAVRMGGEEFALLVPLSRVTECPPDRILSAVRTKPMPFDWKVTVSLGFADGVVETEADWRRLYRLADAALYRAKSDGRDRACRATDFAALGAA